MDSFHVAFDGLLVAAYKSMLKVEELMLRDMSQNSLSIGEMHTLERIGREARVGLNITAIAQEQGVTLPSVTAAVQKLERKGYVRKERNAQDARRVRVELTEKGRKAEVAHRYFHRRLAQAVTAGMDAREREALLSGLSKLNEFLIKSAERADENAKSEGERG